MAKKVTVITPMYNVAPLLEPCVRSLFAQTLKDLELVFVDDCSTDGTMDALMRLLSACQPLRPDISVKILRHDRNRGVAAARNTALAEASGEFICWVDADDRIAEDALESLSAAAMREDADIVVSEWNMVFGSNVRRMHQPDVSTGMELFTAIARGVLRWNLWLFMVRRSLYGKQQVAFIERQNMGEDLRAMLLLSLGADRVCVVHKPFYQYVQTNSSALTRHFSAYRDEVTANVTMLEQQLAAAGRDDLMPLMQQVKLTVKLPLLISSRKADYEAWLAWFPEANAHIGENPAVSWRTRLLQHQAVRRRFWIIRAYYWCVIRFVYGVIFR